MVTVLAAAWNLRPSVISFLPRNPRSLASRKSSSAVFLLSRWSLCRRESDPHWQSNRRGGGPPPRPRHARGFRFRAARYIGQVARRAWYVESKRSPSHSQDPGASPLCGFRETTRRSGTRILVYAAADP